VTTTSVTGRKCEGCFGTLPLIARSNQRYHDDRCRQMAARRRGFVARGMDRRRGSPEMLARFSHGTISGVRELDQVANRCVIGVDVGGTKILAGVVYENGEIGETREVRTPTGSQQEVVAALVGLVEDLRTPEVIAGGFAVPGYVDSSGVAFGANNLPLVELPFHDVLGTRLGLPVALTNDANAAALAEFRLGAGRGTRDLVMLTLGTGVGGGVILDGEPLNRTLEVGHIVIVADGEPCIGICTGRGHVEAYCSGTAAGHIAARELGAGATARDLVEERHPALQQIGRYLGAAIATLIHLFDPEIVVVGGGFGLAAGELLLAPARAVVARELLPGAKDVRIVTGELGESAGMLGAALAAFGVRASA
jgi:glucokinase